MLRIHEKSNITTIPELDIFEVPPTQESKEKTYYTEHRPMATLASDQQIQFTLSTAADEYINLRDIYFYIRFKLNLHKATNIDQDDWKKVNFINNTMHSMLRYVDFEIENKSVVQGPQTYAYKAYFESLLGFSETAKAGYLTAEGFDLNFEQNQKAVTEGAAEKLKPSTVSADGKGRSHEFYGKLHLDLTMQPKDLLGGCKITFTLIPNDPSFYVRSSDAGVRPRVEFQEAALYVSRSKVALPVVEAHNIILSKDSAKYPIMRGVVRSFPVSAGSSDVNLDNAIVGQIPRRVFIAMVDSRGFNGNVQYNPFDFDHFKLNYLIASVDGVQFPSMPMKPDFDNNIFVKEFVALYDVLNQSATDPCVTINKDEFKDKGLAIFAISLGPDSSDECSKQGYVNLVKHGTLNFNLKFAQPLAQNIHVVVYCEYDNLIQILGNREPVLDFI